MPPFSGFRAIKEEITKTAMDDVEIEKHFASEASSFETAVNAFGKVIHNIHAAYKAEEFSDWPTVLLSTLLQTTAMSLYQLLPKKAPGQSGGITDRRSIASLVRNLVDTHDTLDLLCDVRQSGEKFNLHRDIMGYYLSGRLHAARGKEEVSNVFGRLNKTREWYWKRLSKALPDPVRRKRLQSGESLFYMTRRERITKSCGEHADFVGQVLSDLSSYVHSVPPSIWMKRLEDAFADDTQTRGEITVWLRISNFYFARSIDIVLTSVDSESIDDVLKKYIERNRVVFGH
jgi:hypothetical protein